MDVNIKVKIDKDLLNMGKNLHKGTIKGLELCGDLTENEIRKTAVYTDRIGLLRRSTKRQKVNEKEMSVDVMDTTEEGYGIFLNDGTRHIKARHHMDIGLDKASKRFENIIGNAIKKEI